MLAVVAKGVNLDDLIYLENVLRVLENAYLKHIGYEFGNIADDTMYVYIFDALCRGNGKICHGSDINKIQIAKYIIDKLQRRIKNNNDNNFYLMGGANMGIEIMEYMIKKGVSINTNCKETLDIAVYREHVDVVKYIVNYCNNISGEDIGRAIENMIDPWDDVLNKKAFWGEKEKCAQIIEYLVNSYNFKSEFCRSKYRLCYMLFCHNKYIALQKALRCIKNEKHCDTIFKWLDENREFNEKKINIICDKIIINSVFKNNNYKDVVIE